MSERETKTFKAGEHEVVAYAYVTGRDIREIHTTTLSRLEMKADEKGGGEISGFTGEMFAKRENIQIEAVIVSIDGVSENIVDKVIDMKAEDYDVVMTYVKELTEKKIKDGTDQT